MLFNVIYFGTTKIRYLVPETQDLRRYWKWNIYEPFYSDLSYWLHLVCLANILMSYNRRFSVYFLVENNLDSFSYEDVDSIRKYYKQS